ncbi:methionine adenosyltransferase [Streptomyces sp. NRRL S-350]|uniref:methionine adenosyltransferase n=1 Tax=Streptomyces sp. NRRL S-350 TaxID=1463902 RepID=UPI0004C13C9D|nr:methionine adenosyltransferase [Streptomyces sp. NRRL S-350]
MSTPTPSASSPLLPLPLDQGVEVVERKGLGHPDTLADGIAELASAHYSQYCLDAFGAVLHHNLDKVAVLGGRAAFTDTGGSYDRPLRVVFGGRISTSFEGRPIPVREILERAAREQLQQALPGFERVELQIRHETTDSSKFPTWFAPRSLADLPERPTAFSNDTALLVGTWPRTTAETLALATEAWWRRCPWAGSDIKALVVRRGGEFSVTSCVPALAGHLGSAAEFADVLTAEADALTAELGKRLPGPVDVVVNTKGSRAEPLSSQYFTVSGSAVDFGEDGMVGRGNARSGVISGAHGAGNEATFGKNPAYHVGKVGGWLADEAARAVGMRFGPCRVALMWHNGSPYDQPALLQTTTADGTDQPEAIDLVRAVLARTDWVHDLVENARYLPRIEPLDGLLADLDRAPGA